MSPTSIYSLVLVVPCFNETDRLPKQEILLWAERRPDWLWIFVNDGSTDETHLVLESLVEQRDNLRVLSLPRNTGKAEAVRQGILSALESVFCPWFCYLDADFATPPSEISRLQETYCDSELLLVMGCRLKRLGVNINRSLVRHYVGRVAATLISILLQLPTYDTQCGAKLIHHSMVATLFQEPFSSRWLFDVEILARCRNDIGIQAMLDRVMEEPLREWSDKSGSKLRPLDFLRVPVDLWRLHRKYNHGHGPDLRTK